MIDKLRELVDIAKEEYANDVTDLTETEYIVECLLNNGVILPQRKSGELIYNIYFNNEYEEYSVKHYENKLEIKISKKR